MTLNPFREGEVHLRASRIDTRADVIANLAVIAAGAIVFFITRYRYTDLIVGAAIGAYVIREALEIVGQAREAHEQTSRT